MRKTSGFTVVELLITMGVLAVLLVMAVQIGQSVTVNSRFTGLINNFLADFASAKLLASTENRYVAVTFASDGRSYTIQRLADNDSLDGVLYNDWTTVKTVTPLSDRNFFDAGAVSDFGVNSTGEVRLLPINVANPPDNISLVFYIRRGTGSPSDAIAYERTIQILPYGGLQIEK